MLNRATLVNITVFLERATCTGKEALGWAETYSAVVAEINAIDAAATKAPQSPVSDATPPAAPTEVV